MLGPWSNVVEVCRQCIARHIVRGLVGGRRCGDSRRRRTGKKCITLSVVEDCGDIHNLDGDCAIGTRFNACGGLSLCEAVLAHVALSDDAEATVVLGHLIGTGESAILATNALVIEVLNDTCLCVLLVRAHRAPVHARRIEAVVACGRDRLLDRVFGRAAVNHSYRAPRFIMVETVQLIAANHACLAACAGIQIDLEAILLARFRLTERDLGFVERSFAYGSFFVQPSELRNCTEILLGPQVFLNDVEAYAHDYSAATAQFSTQPLFRRVSSSSISEGSSA